MSTRTAKARPAAPPTEGGACLADKVADIAREYRAATEDLARQLPGFDRQLTALVADEIDRLSQLVRFTGATTPAEHRDRMAAMEEGRDEDIIRRAYADGYDHGRREGRETAFDEIILVLKRSAGIR